MSYDYKQFESFDWEKIEPLYNELFKVANQLILKLGAKPFKVLEAMYICEGKTAGDVIFELMKAGYDLPDGFPTVDIPASAYTPSTLMERWLREYVHNTCKELNS